MLFLRENPEDEFGFVLFVNEDLLREDFGDFCGVACIVFGTVFATCGMFFYSYRLNLTGERVCGTCNEA